MSLIWMINVSFRHYIFTKSFNFYANLNENLQLCGWLLCFLNNVNILYSCSINSVKYMIIYLPIWYESNWFKIFRSVSDILNWFVISSNGWYMIYFSSICLMLFHSLAENVRCDSIFRIQSKSVKYMNFLIFFSQIWNIERSVVQSIFSVRYQSWMNIH